MLLDEDPQVGHSRVSELAPASISHFTSSGGKQFCNDIINKFNKVQSSKFKFKFNDLAPSFESIFPLGWSSKGLPVDLRLYNEFDFIPIRSLR